MMEHAWCRDTARDAAVRAAEDNRTQPLPTLAEAIARPFSDAAERSSTVSETGEWPSGIRTERVRLEITSAHEERLAECIVESIKDSLLHGESVRVVEETHFDDLAQVAMERDAAIRERDNERLVRIGTETDRDFARREKDAAIFHVTELRTERDKLQARVASLEAQLESVADRAAAAEMALQARTSTAGEALCAAQAASGGTLAQIAAAFNCQPEDDDDLVEAARLLVRERDEALAKAASGGGQQNVWDGTFGSPAGDRSQNGRLEAASGGGDMPRD